MQEVVMAKRMLSLIVAAAALAVFTPLYITASAAEMNCRVPFSFIVNGKTLPAGAYTIDTSSGAMLVKGAQASAYVMTAAALRPAARSGRGSVVFLKTGSRYHLIEVWGGDGRGREVHLSPRQQEERASAANSPAERIVILAQ